MAFISRMRCFTAAFCNQGQNLQGRCAKSVQDQDYLTATKYLSGSRPITRPSSNQLMNPCSAARAVCEDCASLASQRGNLWLPKLARSPHAVTQEGPPRAISA